MANDLIIKQVNFENVNMIACKTTDGKINVGIRSICDGLGVAFNGQMERINRDDILPIGVRKIRIPTQSGEQETNMLDIEFLPFFLTGIKSSMVKPEIAPKIIKFKLKAKDVLAEAFLKTVKRNSLPYLDQLGKALRENIKLTKGLSMPNQLRSRANALRRLQDQTGVDYSFDIQLLEADADAQEQKLLQTEARAVQKQAEAEAKAERKETKALANTPTGQASQALEWLRIEYTKQGEKLAHVHEDWLLVRSDLWKMWAGKHKLNLTMICRELHNQGIVEKHSESGRERYGIGKRINGKAYTFIWLKKDKLDWLTGTESQTN